jgi:hypothetical protein
MSDKGTMGRQFRADRTKMFDAKHFGTIAALRNRTFAARAAGS